MENLNSVPKWLGLIILMANKDTNPISTALLTLACSVIFNFVATLQELYSWSSFLLQSFSSFFISTGKKCWSQIRRRSDTKAAGLRPCINEDHGLKSGTVLMKGDIELVMEKLGMSWDSSSTGDGVDHEGGMLGSSEISNLFDEIEPSLEEVKEAFDLFDGNKDGYIDAKDLKRILSVLGFVDFLEWDCQKMIMALKNGNNDDGDTRIDLRDFVKIIENSFS